MRTLVLAPESPVPARSGLPLRIQHLARQLARSRSVEVAALSAHPIPNSDHPFELRHLPADWSRRRMRRRWLWEPWPVAQVESTALRDFVRRSCWATVQAHTLQMTRFGEGARAPLVFDAPDAMSGVTATLSRNDSRRGAAAAW